LNFEDLLNDKLIIGLSNDELIIGLEREKLN